MRSTFDLLKQAAHLAVDVASETLWPTRCAVCDLPGDLICASCIRALPFIDQLKICPRCGAPFGRIQCTECNELMMASAPRVSLPFLTMTSAVIGNEKARRIVKLYKDKNERRLVAHIAQTTARCISPDRIREGCVITFIPATRDAVRRRGFDHAQELACHIAEEVHLDCAKLLLPPRTADQRQLGRRERFANMNDAMHVAEGIHIPDRIILFDDICTTGATLYAAADALVSAGAREVHALTYGRVLD